jgi:hypothetical protein
MADRDSSVAGSGQAGSLACRQTGIVDGGRQLVLAVLVGVLGCARGGDARYGVPFATSFGSASEDSATSFIPGEADGEDTGGTEDGAWTSGAQTDPFETSTASDGSTGELPDLDCEPQPLWYRPKDPIDTAPNEFRQWRWIETPGMTCANDTPGGFFVNASEHDRDVIFFFGGGGVCYDGISCILDLPLLLGMGPTPLPIWQADVQSHTGIFDRNDAGNPFRDASFVFFPHCTGDGHTADKISDYPLIGAIHQRGYANVQAAMNVLAPTFEHVERVTVAGFSAGGIGALANYHQIAWLFECLGHQPPLLINDAGPVLRPPYLSALAQGSLRAGWGLDDVFGELCPQCATEGYHTALERIRELHPGVRSALVVAYSDTIVRQLYAALTLNLAYTDNASNRLHEGLHDYASWTAGLPQPTSQTRHREFYYHHDRHGALVVAPLWETPGLAEFLRAQLDDAPQWHSVHP